MIYWMGLIQPTDIGHSLLCHSHSFRSISGSFVIAWKRGIAILTAGNVKVSPDPRLSLVNGHSLQIENAVPQDGGEYVCQIATLEPIEITHLVDILGEHREALAARSGGAVCPIKSNLPNSTHAVFLSPSPFWLHFLFSSARNPSRDVRGPLTD